MSTVEKLQDIGLTKQEATTYLALQELGETKTGKLCKQTGIASSNIYQVLERLINKGLASYRIQNNVKIYMPAPPEALNELFKEKQRKLENERQEVQEIIKSLQEKEDQSLSFADYKYFEGIQGVKAMWHEINERMQSDTPMKHYTMRQEEYQKLVDFWDEHQEKRREKQVPQKMIFPRHDPELAKEREDKLLDIRFMDLDNSAEWGVFGETIILQQITGNPPRSFLIQDKQFAETFKQVFNQLWKQADEEP